MIPNLAGARLELGSCSANQRMRSRPEKEPHVDISCPKRYFGHGKTRFRRPQPLVTARAGGMSHSLRRAVQLIS